MLSLEEFHNILFNVHTINVRELASVYQVAIAFGMAYLALDYFKWAKRLNSIKDEYEQDFKSRIQPFGDARAKLSEGFNRTIDAFTDYYLQTLCSHNSLTHRYENQPPWQKDFMVFLTGLNVGLLLISSLFIWHVKYVFFILCGLPAVIEILAATTSAFHVHKKATRFRETLYLTRQVYEDIAHQGEGVNTALAAAKSVLLNKAADILLSRKPDESIKLLREHLSNNWVLDVKEFVTKHEVLKELNKRHHLIPDRDII